MTYRQRGWSFALIYLHLTAIRTCTFLVLSFVLSAPAAMWFSLTNLAMSSTFQNLLLCLSPSPSLIPTAGVRKSLRPEKAHTQRSNDCKLSNHRGGGHPRFPPSPAYRGLSFSLHLSAFCNLPSTSPPLPAPPAPAPPPPPGLARYSFPQVGRLRKELGLDSSVASMSVDMMLPGGRRGGTMGDVLEARRKLAGVRAASVVVATACAFEHALHQVRETTAVADSTAGRTDGMIGGLSRREIVNKILAGGASGGGGRGGEGERAGGFVCYCSLRCCWGLVV